MKGEDNVESQIALMKPRRGNKQGIRYLSTYGRKTSGNVSVRLEVGSKNHEHGKIIYFYRGKDKKLAAMLANRINYFLSSGKGIEEILLWKDTQMKGEVSRWKEQQK